MTMRKLCNFLFVLCVPFQVQRDGDVVRVYVDLARQEDVPLRLPRDSTAGHDSHRPRTAA